MNGLIQITNQIKEIAMIRIGNTCISSTTILLMIGTLFMSSIAIASILNHYNHPAPHKDIIPQDSTQWIPTKEDIQYQDSMWTIIKQTQSEVDTIKEAIDDIIYKLERIEYSDGSWDSIRTPIESDEERMWISGNGDTIWE